MGRNSVIEEIKSTARQVLPAGSHLYLYGSRARGDAREGSDWDLLLLLDKPRIEESDFDNYSFPFTMLGWNYGEVISPQIYTKREWNEMSFMPYYKNVEHDKIILQ